MRITSASASRIKTYKNCEFKYFLQYHIQLPNFDGTNIYNAKGNAVHEALERYANAKLGKDEKANEDWEEELLKYYKETQLWELDDRPSHKGHPHPVEKTCESCPYATEDDRCQIADRLIAEVEGCPRPNFQEDYDLVKKTLTREDYKPLELDSDGNFVKKIIGVEEAFDMELGGVPVRGFMDLVVEEDEDTLEVIDYKTGRSMSYDKASKDPQVRIYGAVARTLWPQYKNVMVTLFYLKNRPVTVPLDISDDAKTIKSLQRVYNDIVSNDQPTRKKSWLCNFCIGYDECGTIRDAYRVDRRFKLPTIQCNFANDKEPCWGSLRPNTFEECEVADLGQLEYACKGHIELFKSGEYVPEEKG